MEKLILFTGGGSAGHVTPNLALIVKCQQEGWKIAYAGSYTGIEKEIITRQQIHYYAISTDKLRRQLSLKNLLTPFKTLQGIWQAFFLCRKLKPSVVFSKGGFVALPVVVGAWLNRIPVLAHESDMTPGLANRLSFPFAKYICLTFQETTRFFKNKQKLIVTGTPIRPALLTGNAEKGRAFCQFNRDKPMLLILGGGLGAEKVNLAIRAILAILLNHFQIVHVCGKGKIDATCQHEGYKQFDYLNEELADVLASSDIVVSRAGANSIYELLALKKTTLLIPLSRRASRGDQIVNAHYCEKQGFMKVLVEENLNSNILLQTILNLYQEKTTLEKQMMNYQLPDSVQLIYDAISQASS